MTARRLATFGTALGVLLCRAVAGAADPATTCRTGKMVAAGVYDLCLLRAEAKAARRGGLPGVARCNTKFDASWARAESRAGGACPTSGGASAITSQVQADVAAIIAALTPGTTTTTTPSTTTTSSTMPSGPPCGAFPGCGGVCPAGQSCSATVAPGPTTSCTCLPATATPCGSTGGPLDGPRCGGACPAGEVCATTLVDETLVFTCGCITAGQTPCLGFNQPTCGGACPAAMSCGVDPLGLFSCLCQ